jgi:type IV pilus assembly protein PilB
MKTGMSIGQYLIEEKKINQEDLDRCVTLLDTEKYKGYKLGEICFAEGYITMETLGKYLEVSVLDIVKLRGYIDTNIFDQLDVNYLISKKFIPFRRDKNKILQVCLVNIQSKNEKTEIIQYLLARKIITSSKEVAFYLATFDMILDSIDKVSRRHEIEENKLSDAERESKYAESLPEEERAKYYVERILTKAIKSNASDIHIEPYDDFTIVRYRIDGAMTTKPVYKLPKKQYHHPILSIIKTYAALNVAEKRVPQDGSINYLNEEEGISSDLRVSFVNTVRWEKCVIRLLPKSENIRKLDDLHLSVEQMNKITYLADRPKGMILVTGPTGSGKTTTLYAILQHINDGTRNIVTSEDPVEMYIEGINQIQVNKAIEVTFELILRSLLRQDPDVMLIGEIRDKETANIASMAAETGHLVFSTLHTNSGIETINRLTNMGIHSYLLNASLNAVIAQRLIRKLCPHCKKEVVFNEKHKMFINEKIEQSPAKIDKSFLEDNTYFTNEPEGCSQCIQGFKGRVAVYEILIFSNKLKNIISSSATVDVIELTREAIAEGHELLYVDALRKAKSGIISLDELMKIIE